MSSIATSAEWRSHWLAAYTARRNIVKRSGDEADAIDYANDVISMLDSTMATDQRLNSLENRAAWISNVIALTMDKRGLGLTVAGEAASAVLQALETAGGTSDNSEAAGKLPVMHAGTLTRYIRSGGNDGNAGEGGDDEEAWATIQRAALSIPMGYAGKVVFDIGPGTFETFEIPVTVSSLAEIAFVGDRSSPTPVSPTFAWLDNARATANVGTLGDFARGERWLEPSVLPAPAQAGTLAFAGTVPDALVGSTLTAVMGDLAAGDNTTALHAYGTLISGGNPLVGTRQGGANVQLVGLSISDSVQVISGCLGVGAKILGSNLFVNLQDCGGMWAFLDDSGQVTPYIHNTFTGTYAGSYSGIFESTIFTRSGDVTVTTFVSNPGASQPAVISLQGSFAQVLYGEVESGFGMAAGSNSRMFVLGFINFDPSCGRAWFSDGGSVMKISGGGYAGSVTGIAAVADESSRIDGAIAAAVASGGTDMQAGTVTGAYGGGAIVDTGPALSAIT